MNSYALEIPDEPASLAGWIERQLTGLDLSELAAELSVVHGAPEQPSHSVREVLGADLRAVLENGLGRVTPETLRQLLVQPALLLELQEIVLAEGGTYWDRISRPAATLDAHAESGRRRLAAFLSTEEQVHQTARPRIITPTRGVWYRRPALVSLATAAAVLLAVFLFERFGRESFFAPARLEWGWNKPGVLQNDRTPKDYLDRLAHAAGEWFDEHPEKAGELAERLNDFRRGCSRLILAEHAPLASKDREWLVKKCRDWAAKLDGHLTDLEAGKDTAQVRAEVDKTITNLISALRTHARLIAAAKNPKPSMFAQRFFVC
jgi:hypothetical protein